MTTANPVWARSNPPTSSSSELPGAAAARPVPLYNEAVCPQPFVRTQRSISASTSARRDRTAFTRLATVYQTLELYDVVTVTARPAAETTALRLTSNDDRVPSDARNTAWKMVALALEALGVTAEVEIDIEKRLPVQGGIGAGSANAVAALMGLESELALESRQVFKSANQLGAPSFERFLLEGWESTNPPGDSPASPTLWAAQRLEIAAQVGSDVPLFLIGGTVLGLDRGQKVEPLPDIEPVWCVIATPSIGVSTPQAFRDWDALCTAEGLTQDESQAKLNELNRAYASAFAGAISQGGQRAGSSGVLSLGEDRAGPQESALVRTGITSWIQNDFERVVFPQHPSLAEIKRILLGPGTPEAALVAMLSGSGSALFGLYLACGDAEAVQERLRAAGVQSHIDPDSAAPGLLE